MSNTARRIRLRVAGVLVQGNNILLVKHRKNEQEYWLLPGGGVDPGESLSNALAREMWEELRVQVSCGSILCVNDSIPPDGSRHILNVYMFVKIINGEPRLGNDPRVVEVAWHEIGKIKELALFPAIGEELEELLRNGEKGAKYLGALWKDA